MEDQPPRGRQPRPNLEPVTARSPTPRDQAPAVEVIPPRGGPPRGVVSAGAPGLDLGEFEAIFQFAPLAMILVDPGRMVRRLNRAACSLAGTTAEIGLGQLPGALLCCAHLDDEAGCGLGPRCEGCTLRQLIEESFATRESFTQVETTAPFYSGGHRQERVLRISSSFLCVGAEPRTLLCIEDLTGNALPPGTRPSALGGAPDLYG